MQHGERGKGDPPDDEPDDAPPRRPSAPPGEGSVRPPERISASARPPLGPHPLVGAGRIVFTLAWLGGQTALVLTADRRPDGAFGYRMFSESSSITVVLYREVDTDTGDRARTHVDHGVWTAKDSGGAVHRLVWAERVRRPELGMFDREIHASYGARAQLDRWRAALDDVAAHVPEDAETRRFLVDITVRRNGREPYVVHLASAERPFGGGR